MAIQVQWRRGTTAENDAFTGAIGEVTVDTTVSGLRIHDGVTAGGSAAGGTGFGAGTRMLFHQTAAPTGWTRDTASTYNDVGLRVMASGTWVAGPTGTTGVAAHWAAGLTSGTHAGTAPAHTHTVNLVNTSGGATAMAVGVSDGLSVADTVVTSSGGAGGTHSHTYDLDVKYTDVIIASKDA